MSISEELRRKLLERGASVVGFADLSEIPEGDRNGFRYGIIIGVALNPGVVLGIKDGPTLEYFEEFNRVNSLLNELDEYAAGLLCQSGYQALPKTQSVVRIDENTKSTQLPHKTVATRAGTGWIGKCALLVTEEYGSAIRISSVLTDAVLDTGVPVNQSRCGTCERCRIACPAGAVSGTLWEVGMNRDQFYHAFDCRKTALERSRKAGIDYTLCGMCILVCPWTRKYLKKGIRTMSGGLELLPEVRSLWEGLREHHADISEHFSESIRQRTFDDRMQDFLLKEGDHTFRVELALVDGQEFPMGYCISSVNREGIGEIESLYIDEKYRRLDIGDLLMKHALEWMDTKGVKSKRICVLYGNDVLRFYEKYGFKVRSLTLEQVE